MGNLDMALEMIQGAGDPQSVFDAFTAVGRDYGFNNACFTLMSDHAQEGLPAYHGFATDYPEDWMEHYRSHGYLDIDPVVYMARRGSRPFCWAYAVDVQAADKSLSEDLKSTSRTLMREAADAGLADGIGVSLFTQDGGMSAVGLSCDTNTETIPQATLAELGLLAAAFHERFLSFYRGDPLVQLTSREVDVLSWSAEGKTDGEIALLLGVSKATIRFHWKNIFCKLNAINKVNATAKAIRLNLVSVSLVDVPDIRA